MTGHGLFVGIELGGTKVVVAGGRGGPELVGRTTIPTRHPESTFAAIRASVAQIVAGGNLDGIGVASFGPIDLRPGSSSHGEMMETPKTGWSGTNVIAGLAAQPSTVVALDTDVNAAVVGEHVWGSGTADNVAYLTVGTGIGGGIWSEGRVLRGANHPEIGHIRTPRHPDDRHAGSCPFHGDCLEGMASGTAIRDRWGLAGEELSDGTAEVVAFEAWYLAHGIAGLCAVIPVEQVIIGGGVSKIPGLREAVSRALPHASGGYPGVPFASGGPEILGPGLGDDAGVVGAIEMARALTSHAEQE